MVRVCVRARFSRFAHPFPCHFSRLVLPLPTVAIRSHPSLSSTAEPDMETAARVLSQVDVNQDGVVRCVSLSGIPPVLPTRTNPRTPLLKSGCEHMLAHGRFASENTARKPHTRTDTQHIHFHTHICMYMFMHTYAWQYRQKKDMHIHILLSHLTPLLPRLVLCSVEEFKAIARGIFLAVNSL